MADADDLLLLRVGDVEVVAIEGEGAYLGIHFLDQFFEALSGLGHEFENEQADPDAVAFGDMPFDGQASGFFAADDDVFLGHDLGDIFEADLGHLVV